MLFRSKIRKQFGTITLVSLFALLGLFLINYNVTLGIIIFVASTIAFYTQDKNNIFKLSAWFLLYPFIVSLVVIFGIASLYPSITTNNFFVLLFMFLAASAITIPAVIVFSKREKFLDRFKVSISINNVFYFLLLSMLFLYVYSMSDFNSFISPAPEKLEQWGNPREYMMFLIQFLSFPFLLNNLVLSAIVEYLQFKDNEKASA